MLRRHYSYPALVLFLSTYLLPQGAAHSPNSPATTSVKGSLGNIDILSNTEGVDFGSYLESVLRQVRLHWYRIIPEVARPPLMKQGNVTIEFSILKDGRVADLHNTGSSGDVSMDSAASDAIGLSDPFGALPSEFQGQYLALRFHFQYNPFVPPPRGPTVTARVLAPRGTTLSPSGISLASPAYPKRAVKAKQSGTVILSALVTKKGDVRRVELLQGISNDMDKAAIKTVKHWKFKPVMRDGKPADVSAQIEMTFHLN